MRLASLRRAAIAVPLLLAAAGALAQSPPLAPRDVPAKRIPVPDTVSPEMQQIIVQPLRTPRSTPTATT